VADENLGGKFVYIIAALGIFIILITTMPSQFYSISPDYEGHYYPEFFTQADIEHFRHIASVNVTRNSFPYTDHETINFNDETPAADFKFLVYFMGGPYNKLQIRHVHYEFLIFMGAHPLNWLVYQDEAGRYISKTEALEYWDSNTYSAGLHPVFCDHITIKVWLTDPNSTRNSLSDAWDEGELQVTIGFGFSDYETTVGSWALVGQLLMFQAPDVHPALNAIIALPLWGLIAYLAYRLILMAIPFVGE